MQHVKSPNQTGSSVLESLKKHPELKYLKFHKVKQDQLQSTFPSVPVNLDAIGSSIQPNQPRTAEELWCTPSESNLNEISQTQRETSIALVIGGSQDSDVVASTAQTSQLSPIKAAVSTKEGDLPTETTPGQQGHLLNHEEASSTSESTHALKSFFNHDPRVHRNAEIAMIQSNWVS